MITLGPAPTSIRSLHLYFDLQKRRLKVNEGFNEMRENLCGETSNRVRRELVKGSLEVHPINNYGAVQTGEHRFYLTQKGQKEKLDGVGKFVVLWRKEGGEWRISRVISYGFGPPE